MIRAGSLTEMSSSSSRLPSSSSQSSATAKSVTSGSLSSSSPSKPPSSPTLIGLTSSLNSTLESSWTSNTPSTSGTYSGSNSPTTYPPLVSTSNSVISSRTLPSPSSEPSLLNRPLAVSTDQNHVFTTSTQPDAGRTEVPVVGSTSHGFFGNRGAFAGTFTAVGIAAVVILLTIFLCCRRYRSKKQRQLRIRNMHISQPRIRENPFADDPFVYFDPRDHATTAERQHNQEERPSLSATDKQVTGYAGSGDSTYGLNVQRNDVGNGILYETRNPRLTGINPGIVVNYRDRELDDPFSDRQAYQQNPRPAFYGKGPAAVNHSLAVTSSRAYLPFPSWRPASEISSSPSLYPATPSVTEDGDSVHQLPTPTSVAYPRTTPNQGYNWGASAKRSSSYRASAQPEAYRTPPGSDDGQGSPAIAQQEPPTDGQDRSIPPPIPPKSPLRAAMSMRTILDVRVSKME
ncbi:hypothetical protein BDM02DRAFT_428576 [Thelephora ganbajun]|uniref:Uncharacterized protein n=1 Tax=Thelephora ganbajun TaxID=370292 RepID=A0ACB6ZQC7_THEGA|nr:hypothetical protein BDM02DRAFT_428576 [Thelephora ganbajun]